MHRYLFTVPGTEWSLATFGLMLFIAFILVLWWGMRRGLALGLPREKTQDLALALFLTGIIGARIVFMIQNRKDFAGMSWGQLALEFVSIWNGGIVFYGSVFGGIVGYLIYRRVVRRFGISSWQIADMIAPLLALGLAVGRIGCYLNGCCWGQVAVPEVQPVPLGGSPGEFPLLPAYCRKDLCKVPSAEHRLPQNHGLQTSTGFALGDRKDGRKITAVEPGSDAARQGLKPEDRIIAVDGEENDSDSRVLWNLVENWEKVRKGESRIRLTVESPGSPPREVTLRPVTMPFYPTQLYETISMLLLTLLLVAFQPFRRHDGQVMVLLMMGYAVHRFLNEAIRIEPTYTLPGGIDVGLTLSQWISVLIFLAAVVLEVYLRLTQPKLPPGAVPLGYKAAS